MLWIQTYRSNQLEKLGVKKFRAKNLRVKLGRKMMKSGRRL